MQTYFTKSYANNRKSRESFNAKNKELEAKYEEMLDSVRKWLVPSFEHKTLKEFMIS